MPVNRKQRNLADSAAGDITTPSKSRSDRRKVQVSMDIPIRAYTQADIPALIRIWNEVVEDGVASNTHARHLYERLGFQPLGVIPGGFRMKDGHYEDICPYYHVL